MLEFWFSPEVSLAIQRVVIIVFKYLCHTVPAFDRCLSINCPCRCRFDLGSTCGTTAPKCWRGRRGSHHYAAGSRSANISRLSFHTGQRQPQNRLRVPWLVFPTNDSNLTMISPQITFNKRKPPCQRIGPCWWSNVFSAKTCRWFLLWLLWA